MSAPASPVFPGLLAVDVVTSTPGAVKTYRVRLRYRAGQPPTALLEALAAAGFNAPPVGAGDVEHALPTTIVVVDLTRRGTGPFHAWTAGEHHAAMASLQDVFTHFQIAFAPRAEPTGNRL